MLFMQSTWHFTKVKQIQCINEESISCFLNYLAKIILITQKFISDGHIYLKKLLH